MNSQLYLQIGSDEEFNLHDKIPEVEFLELSSPPVVNNAYTDNDGIDGSMLNYSTFSLSAITADFYMHFSDWRNFQALKDRIYKLFDNRQVIRLRTDAQPNMIIYVRSNSFDISPISDGSYDVEFSIVFDNPTGYKYSLLRTDAMTDLFDDYPLGYDIPIQTADDYYATGNSITILNGGDVAIDPYYQHHDLKVKIHYAGDELAIYNHTNGSSWRLTKTLTKSDVVLIDGIDTYVNGTLATDSTDYNTLVLDVGQNDLAIGGSSDFDVTFSFPYVLLD